MRRTAFIFGAGASVGATRAGNALPAQSALLHQLVSADTTSPELKTAHDLVMCYLKAMYPGRRHGMAMPFEEVVGPLEWLESRESPFHIGQGTMRNVRTLAAFDTLLAHVLNRPTYERTKIGNPKSGVSQPAFEARYNDFYSCRVDSPNAYAALLSKLLAQQAQFELISFNYDLLLDRAIFHESSGTHVNYHVPFYRQEFYRGEGVSLIKPHGSLNWVWCPICKWLSVFGTKVVYSGSACPNCLPNSSAAMTPANWVPGNLRPMLLRPSFLKTSDIAGAIWSTVIDTGAQLLSDCDDWVFVGYSFPLADSWIRGWLRLAASLATRPLPRRVVLVDPSDGAAPERYHAFFGARFRHRKQTFWDFVRDWKGPKYEDAA